MAARAELVAAAGREMACKSLVGEVAKHLRLGGSGKERDWEGKGSVALRKTACISTLLGVRLPGELKIGKWDGSVL